MSAKNFVAITLLGLAGLASAQQSVISLFIPNNDPAPLAASIMGQDATATTYSVNCAPGTDSNNCGLGPGLTVVARPTTTAYGITMGGTGTFFADITCSVGGTTTAICVETMGGSEANASGASTATLGPSDITFFPVTITAGRSSGPPATTTPSGATASSSTAGASQTASRTSTAASTRASGSSGTSTSKGGVAQRTGGAKVALGGAGPAAIALAAAIL